MQTLLKETWHKVKLARLSEQLLSKQERYQIEQTYDEIISQGETKKCSFANFHFELIIGCGEGKLVTRVQEDLSF